MSRTSYGIRKPGRSKYVFIAPHAAGDDLRTGRIARKLAKLTGGFLIINKRFFKPTNSKAVLNPESVEDFNKLSWSDKHQKYLWKRKKPQMKEFFDDIVEYCDQAAEISGERAVAVYVHGMNDDKLAIDIGVGLVKIKDRYRFIGSSKSHYRCSGQPTIPISLLKSLHKELGAAFDGQTIGIGNRFPAWGKRIAVQFHKWGRNDHALQLEISHELKHDDSSLETSCSLIAKSLTKAFK